jgi:hypothetical protein
VLFDDENSFGPTVTLFDEFKSLSTNAREITPQAVDKAKTVGYILCSSGTTGKYFFRQFWEFFKY